MRPARLVPLQRAFEKVGRSEALKVVRNGEQAIAYLGGSGAYADRHQFPLPFLVLLDLRIGRRRNVNHFTGPSVMELFAGFFLQRL